MNKVDAIGHELAQEQIELLEKETGQEVKLISAVSGDGVQEILYALGARSLCSNTVKEGPMSEITTQDILNNAETIIIKVGSVLITDEERDMVRQNWLDAFAEDVKDLIDQGKKVAIVTSGGIALGRLAMDIAKEKRPEEIRLDQKQAASSIGQFMLFHGYHKAFDRLDIYVGQVLLTMGETENRRMHLNAREAL